MTADIRVFTSQRPSRSQVSDFSGELVRVTNSPTAVVVKVVAAKGELFGTTARIRSEIVYPVILSSLGHGRPRLQKPMHCVVEPIGNAGNFVASFPEAQLFASGDTKVEAIENLGDIVATKFRIFSSHEPSQLGPVPKKQLAVLRKYIKS
jgi:hypothetical protein